MPIPTVEMPRITMPPEQRGVTPVSDEALARRDEFDQLVRPDLGTDVERLGVGSQSVHENNALAWLNDAQSGMSETTVNPEHVGQEALGVLGAVALDASMPDGGRTVAETKIQEFTGGNHGPSLLGGPRAQEKAHAQRAADRDARRAPRAGIITRTTRRIRNAMRGLSTTHNARHTNTGLRTMRVDYSSGSPVEFGATPVFTQKESSLVSPTPTGATLDEAIGIATPVYVDERGLRLPRSAMGRHTQESSEFRPSFMELQRTLDELRLPKERLREIEAARQERIRHAMETTPRHASRKTRGRREGPHRSQRSE